MPWRQVVRSHCGASSQRLHADGLLHALPEHGPGIPLMSRNQQGPVPVIECYQEIACNPCETACPFGAIHIGHPITNTPRFDSVRCVGCGQCVAACPGLAIRIVDTSRSDHDLVMLPYEMLPVPREDTDVHIFDHAGEKLGIGRVIHVSDNLKLDRTRIVTVLVDKGAGLLTHNLKVAVDDHA